MRLLRGEMRVFLEFPGAPVKVAGFPPTDPGRTSSVDQYGATLASWFGVSNSDLKTVFPNITSFGSDLSSWSLGFMS